MHVGDADLVEKRKSPSKKQTPKKTKKPATADAGECDSARCPSVFLFVTVT